MYRRTAIASAAGLLAGCGSIVGGSESGGNPLGEQPENPSFEVWRDGGGEYGYNLFISTNLNQSNGIALELENGEVLGEVKRDTTSTQVANGDEPPNVSQGAEIQVYALFDGFRRNIETVFVPFRSGKDHAVTYTPSA